MTSPSDKAFGSRRKRLHGVRVLVVEDDVDSRDLLAFVLTQAGAEVDQAGSVRDAFHTLHERLPDVVVSDIGMPGEDGYSFMRALRTHSPELGGKLPAIALTAYTQPEDRRRAFAAGFNDHLGKPVVVSELVSSIERLVLGS